MSGVATFAIGERVTKKSGSSWTGRVVGTYSTALTPEGYAVESENEPGSVQIYPAAALRRLSAIATAQPVDTEGLVEAVAKTHAFARRSRHDQARDADHYWQHLAAETQAVEIAASRAAISALPPRMDDVRREALEEAAKVAEAHYAGHGGELGTLRAHHYEHAGKRIAAALRALTKGSSDG